MDDLVVYDPSDWFWVVDGDTTRAWSSADGAYVEAWPADRVTRIASETELRDVLKPIGLPSPLVTADDYGEAIEAHADAVARSRQYRDADRLASYVNSKNTAWAAEATAFVAWRDAAWGYAYALMASVQGGQAPPTVEAVIAGLPVIVWPE